MWKKNSDCCESVFIESIVGDLTTLILSPIVVAEVAMSSNETPKGLVEPDCDSSFTWSFYKLASTRGSVDIRFFGTSNGYYSETVDFLEIVN